jgi:DNA polymerase-3 subunit beta
VKLDINRDLFSRALAKVQGVLSRKAAMPVLSNVYLSVDTDGLMRLAASDLDVTYDGYLQCRCIDAGSVTVDGKRLFDVVRSLPGEEVHLEINAEHQVTISCQNTEFVLLGHSVDSYPPLPSSEHVSLSNLDGFALKELLERTMLSISTDESRPNLNGVYLEFIDDGRIRMVSTDGHRLSRGEKSVEGSSDLPGHEGIIIPKKGVIELKKLLDEIGSEVSIGFIDNNLIVRSTNLTLYIRLIDAAFPDYQQVIPKSSERVVVLERIPFLQSLKRIGLLASERTHGVRVELNPGLITLLSDNPDLGKAREEIEVEYDGPSMIIAFNAKYIQDILSTLGAEKVEMALNEALSPGLFREHESDDYLFVIMPMRI